MPMHMHDGRSPGRQFATPKRRKKVSEVSEGTYPPKSIAFFQLKAQPKTQNPKTMCAWVPLGKTACPPMVVAIFQPSKIQNGCVLGVWLPKVRVGQYWLHFFNKQNPKLMCAWVLLAKTVCAPKLAAVFYPSKTQNDCVLAPKPSKPRKTKK